MITTVFTEPIIESVISDPENYSTGYGFYQIGLDCVREHSEIINMMIQQEFNEYSCIDNTSLISLQEAGIKDIFAKLSEMVKSFIERFSLAFQRMVSKLTTGFSVTKDMITLVNTMNKNDDFEDSSKSANITIFKDPKTLCSTTIRKTVDIYSVVIAGMSKAINNSSHMRDNDKLKPEFIKSIAYGCTAYDGSLTDYFKENLTKEIIIKKTGRSIQYICDELTIAIGAIAILDQSRKSIIKEFQTLQKNLSKMRSVQTYLVVEDEENNKKYVALLSSAISTCIAEVNRYFTALMIFYGTTIRSATSTLSSLCKGKSTTKDEGDKSKSTNESTFWTEAVEEPAGEGWDTDKKQPEGWANPTPDAEPSTSNTKDMKEEFNMFDTDDQSVNEMLFWEAEFGDDFIEPTDPTVDETEPQINPEVDQYQEDPAEDDAGEEFMGDDGATQEITIESKFII